MMNKRVKAFTIMEVTVAMLLTAIVIAITYTVYSIVARSYGEYGTKNNNRAVLIRLDELLRKDFEKAETINKTETGLTCSKRDGMVTYEFRPDGVVRSSGITDTFKVSIAAVDLLFEHALVGARALSGEDTRIDELRLDILFEKNNIDYSYHKQYSSENLIQRKNNALN